MENLTDELRYRPDWSIFYGSVPTQALLKSAQEPEKIKSRLVARIGRAIKDHNS
jgi:hypothetical protein